MLTLKPADIKKKTLEIENEIKRRIQTSEKSLHQLTSFEQHVLNKVRSTVTNETQKIRDKIGTVVKIEQKIQTVAIATVQEKQPPAQIPPDVVLNPVQVNGFYKVTNHNTLTFYVNTPFPMLNATQKMPLVSGWKVIGMTGVSGLVILTKVNDQEGNVQLIDDTHEDVGNSITESYLWSFECQTDTEQNIQGTHGVIGLILYPPDASSLTTNSVTGILNGFYYVARNDLTLYILNSNIPTGFGKGWSVSGLTGLKSSNVFVTNFIPSGGQVAGQYDYQSYATLQGDQVEDNTSAAVNVSVVVKQPDTDAKIIGANVVSQVQYTASNAVMKINSKLTTTGGPPLRDLNEDVKAKPLFQEEYKDLPKVGYNAATTYALYAVGPQEKYVQGKDDNVWNTDFPQHSNFVCYQRYVPIQGTQFLGQTIMVQLKPKELGDLLSNMYFICQLPPLTSSSNIYTNQVGRSMIAQCDFMVNDTIVETVYDDWFFIKDQVFLDGDEQIGMRYAVNGGSPNSLSPTSGNTTICVPLEFFFCRRHSYNTQGRERLRRPYFPMCALWQQYIYIRIQFQPWVWISNDLAVANKEIINPALILEEIKLTDAERLYYKSKDLRYVVNKLKKESVLSFSSYTPQLQLTASFPVQMLIWFFRNKKYETVTSQLYNDSRYEYGFTTKYVKTAIPLDFVSQTSYFVDPVQSIQILLNNINITSTFDGSLYYTFKQPMEHNLSIPAKNIYMYSFGLNPKEYNAGGYINFSKLNSQTTTIQIVFQQKYAQQVFQGYNLYMFYYGYTILEFSGGFARLPFMS
jgi:hypothetical protein